jgi:cytochrome b561
MFYDRFTRILHIFLAAGIALQLIASEWMHHPRPQKPGNLLYDVHEYIGLFLLAILIIHWLWSFVRGGVVPLAQLFPWFSKDRRGALRADIKLYGHHLLRLKLPDASEPSPLAGAIQGVGLAIASVLAITGTLIYFTSNADWTFSPVMGLVKEVHELLGPVMWGYLAVHAGAALLHQLLGHRLITDMFDLRRKSS